MVKGHRHNGTSRGKLTDRQLDLIVRQVSCLPMVPAGARRLLELVIEADGQDTPARPEAAEQAMAIASLEPSLTARLISQANRSRANSAATVAQAVERLGFGALRAAVLSANLELEADAPARADGLNRQAFLKHSLAVAVAARAIAQAVSLPLDSQEVFVCGLLHDIGKLAMDVVLPKSYARVLAGGKAGASLAQREADIIGVDHTVFGRRLAEHWRLGSTIESVIWLHHQLLESIPETVEDRPVILVVALADALARQLELGFSGNHSFSRTAGELAAQVNLSESALEDIQEQLPKLLTRDFERICPASKAGVSSAQVIARAGGELARLNEQLQNKTQALAQQARAFSLLSDFNSLLAGGSSVSDILMAVARTSSESMGLAHDSQRPVIVYAVDACGGGAGETLALRFAGAEDVSWRASSLASSKVSPAVTAAVGPALAATSAVFGRQDNLSDWADMANYLHQPLLCAGQWVGGLILPDCTADTLVAGKTPAPLSDESWKAIIASMAMALSIVQDRSRAVRMSEQLASASSVLAEASEALAQTRTLAAVGEMAAGAAHELNNPLAVISGRAQIMRDKAASPDDRKVWQIIVDQAQRLSDIITDLMAFAKPPTPSPRKVDVRELFQAAATAFAAGRATQAPPAAVDIEVEDQTPALWADGPQVQEVVAELLANAANAAAGPPHIRLKAGRDSSGQSVLLTVEDDGPGMDEPTLGRAFTPFFSSHPAGRRRGLGLPRARRHVEINSGRIWIESRKPAGTKVFILLPAASENGNAEHDP